MLLLLRSRAATVHTGSGLLPMTVSMTATGTVMAIGAAEMSITLDVRASSTVTTIPLGGAWTGVVLDGNDGTIGAAELGVTLAEDAYGVVSPGDISSIQHQGAAVLAIRSGYTADGQAQPIITVPAQAQDGKAQVSVGFSMATQSTGQNLGSGNVLMRFAFEAGGQTAPDGSVITHPKNLNVEFNIAADERVIVNIPPLPDWDPIKLLNYTEEVGDPEFS